MTKAKPMAWQTGVKRIIFVECAITFSFYVIAGRLDRDRVGLLEKLPEPNQTARPDPGHASLREDYLNQVQRDFLSRATKDATPLANVFLQTQQYFKPARIWR
jgi:hypothetical protein